MDTVYIRDLRVEARIGIWEWEQRIRQQVRIDLEMAADIGRAAASDRIEDALNYRAVAKRVQGFLAEHEFGLVETMAEALARLIMEEFRVPWLRLRVGKPGAVRGSREVGVVIERGEVPEQ
ncbi:MAG TPA: dihydroneopterin aldolase [Chromatiales bacterium]|nr:dihydroneopterin aldolase [Chromatiales bacterium]